MTGKKTGLICVCALLPLLFAGASNAQESTTGAPPPPAQKISTLDKATAIAGSLAAMIAAYKAARAGMAPAATTPVAAPKPPPGAASTPALGTSLQ